MSLINEALKKVSEADRGKPQKTDFEMRAMQPAPYERRISPLLWVTIPALILAVGIALGGLLLAKFSQQKQRQTQIVTAVAKVTPAVEQPATPVEPAKPVVAVVAPEPVKAPEPAPTPVAATPAAPAVVAETPSPAPVAQPAPAPAGPTFRLKGILFSKNPTALINESSVQVGAEVDGATITKIDPTAVTLEYQGKVTILKLGAH